MKELKHPAMDIHRNVNRHSMNGMDAASAAAHINGNKKRFSVSDVSDMLYEFYRANAAAKAPKTQDAEKSFRQKSPSSADAAAGGEGESMHRGIPNEPQTSKTTTAPKNSNGDEMTNTNKMSAINSAFSSKKNTSSFHPRIKYSSVMNKSSAAAAVAAAAAAVANMENTPAQGVPTSVVVPPLDIKPTIVSNPASVIKPPTMAGAAPAAAAIAAALLRDGYHNFQQQLRVQDILKQQTAVAPLAHNNQSGGSVQPLSGQNKGLIFGDNFARKENRSSENENDQSDSDYDDEDDDDGRYSGFDDIHLIEGSKSSFNNQVNLSMPPSTADYMSDESQKYMMAAQAQALRNLEYSLSDYGGTNPSEEPTYQCRHCGKKYRWKSTLRRHENVECGGKEPAHQCPYCPYKSKQRGNLGVHVRKHHSNLPQLASKRRSKYSQQREVKIEAEKAF